MEIQGEYGVALTFVAPIVKAGSDDLAASGDWTPATGDVQVSKDGGAFANITTLPTAATTAWVWALSATEMEASRIVVRTVDSATKVVKDQTFLIRTLPPGAIAAAKLSAVASNTITFPNAAPFNVWADNQPNGNIVVPHGGTGRGQAGLGIIGYVASTRVATLDRTPTVALDTTTVVTVYPAAGQGTDPASYVRANVKAVDDGTTEAANLKTAMASTIAEVSAVPPANAPIWTAIKWLLALSRNRITQTSTTKALKNDANSGNIATAAVSDDGTTYDRNEWV
jgi:hypothetical protein